MERFVFVTAVTCALIYAAFSLLGGHGHSLKIDVDFDGPTAELVEVAPGRFEQQAFAGARLSLDHTAAHVVITPEAREDFLIEIDNPGHAPMPTVDSDGDTVAIDGHLRGRIGDCQSGGGADLRGYGEFPLTDLPTITIRAPMTLKVDLSGAGLTEIGASQSLQIDQSGCGEVTFADVADAVSLDLAGSGAVRGGAARSLSADMAGSGSASLGAVANGAEVDLAGSGNVVLASLIGALTADQAGSGSVTIQGGALSSANIDLASSGKVTITAPVQRLDASVLGSGEVIVEGTVGDLNAEIAGSGRATAQAATGAVRCEVLGSGEVVVAGARVNCRGPG